MIKGKLSKPNDTFNSKIQTKFSLNQTGCFTREPNLLNSNCLPLVHIWIFNANPSIIFNLNRWFKFELAVGSSVWLKFIWYGRPHPGSVHNDFFYQLKQTCLWAISDFESSAHRQTEIRSTLWTNQVETFVFELETFVFELETFVFELETFVFEFETFVFELETFVFELETFVFEEIKDEGEILFAKL